MKTRYLLSTSPIVLACYPILAWAAVTAGEHRDPSQ
jgi:hypothetical protein